MVTGARAGATPVDVYGTSWGRVLEDLDPDALAVSGQATIEIPGRHPARRVNADELTVRRVVVADLAVLAAFRCSTGEPWENLVEDQVRGPLPRRYLSVPPHFDGRMQLGCDRAGAILVIGAHHIEPTLVPDVGVHRGGRSGRATLAARWCTYRPARRSRSARSCC